MRNLWSALVASVLMGGCVGYVDPGGETSGSSGGALMCMDTYSAEMCSYREDTGGCFVTGIGHIGDAENHPGAGRADQDSFGGNAMGMKDGSVRGQWQNTTHLGDLFHGSVSWLRCWNDGGLGPEVPRAIPNVAQWGGLGKWNHVEGYRFMVRAADRAEGGHHIDEYAITIWNPEGNVIYSENEIIDGGNFQIHPPNAGHPYESVAVPPEYGALPGL